MNKHFFIFMCMVAVAFFLDALLPFVPCSNVVLCDFGLGAGIALGAANLLGSVFGGFHSLSAQSEANEQNIAMQRETNAQQYKMFQEQMEFNKEQQLQQQEYDNAVNQRKRFEEAGFNPYLMVGNADAGKFQTMSAPAAPPLTAPSMSPEDVGPYVQDAFKTLGNSAMQFFQTQSISEDAKQKAIDNINRYEMNLAEIQQKKSAAGVSDAQKKFLDAQEFRLRKLLRQEYRQLKSSNDLVEEDIQNRKAEREGIHLNNDILGLQKDYQTWYNDFAQKHGEKELKQLDSIIAANMASANASNASAALALAQNIVAQAQEEGIKLDNDQKRELNKLILTGQKLENKRKELENKYGTNWFTAAGRLVDRVWNHFSKPNGKSRSYNKLVNGVPTVGGVVTPP